MSLMIISIIVAIGQNREIGKDNRMLWYLPADLKYFKETTMGKPLIMGRKTYESLGRPLPGRKNIVITRKMNYSAPGCTMAFSIEEAIHRSKPAGEVFIAGGGEIYQQAMALTERLYITKIHGTFPADTFFPKPSHGQWKKLKSDFRKADTKNPYDMEFIIYERIKNS